MKTRDHIYLCVGNALMQKCVLKITARRAKDIVLSIPMATEVNFHTSRKGAILHNTTYNAKPALRRYFEVARPALQELESVELLKCVELSTTIFSSPTYPVWSNKDKAIILSNAFERNILVSILLGPAAVVQEEHVRLAKYGNLSLWQRDLAGFALLVVGTPTNRIGGDAICDATRYYNEVHDTAGIGPYKEDFVYYL